MYIVVEIKTGDTVKTRATSFNDRKLAERKYHTVLASAAVSDFQKHAAVLMTDDGMPLMHMCYTHEFRPDVLNSPEPYDDFAVTEG